MFHIYTQSGGRCHFSFKCVFWTRFARLASIVRINDLQTDSPLVPREIVLSRGTDWKIKLNSLGAIDGQINKWKAKQNELFAKKCGDTEASPGDFLPPHKNETTGRCAARATVSIYISTTLVVKHCTFTTCRHITRYYTWLWSTLQSSGIFWWSSVQTDSLWKWYAPNGFASARCLVATHQWAALRRA